MRPIRALAVLGTVGLAPAAGAQPIDFMLNECSSIGQTYFRDFTARTDMQYNGQRVDGTHAINGRIFLETRFEDFACSYERSGRRMVEFFAEGRLRNTYLPGGSGQSGGSDVLQVTGIAMGDILNVRSGPGAGYRIIGALANGDAVRNLGCQAQGGSRWCQIEMMTDMRERGWVNARYLTQGSATQLPGPPSAGTGGSAAQLPSPPSAGTGDTATLRVRFAPGTNGVELAGALAPGESRRYILGARAGQNLVVRVAHRSGPRTDFQIFHPDGSLLMAMTPTDKAYRGRLFLSGDHVVEVINRGGRTAEYTVTFRIR